MARREQFRWLVKDGAGNELDIIKAPDFETAKVVVEDEHGLTGGYSLRRLADDERVMKVDRNITPDLYY